MSNKQSTVGWWGIGIGAVALLLVLVHFYAGPISPQPSLEQTVADKAVAIRDATVAALKGDAVEPAATTPMDLDQLVMTGGAVLGGLAIVLGVVGYARHESVRVASGAAVLGAGAIAFQFAVVALGVLVVALLVAVVLSNLGFG